MEKGSILKTILLLILPTILLFIYTERATTQNNKVTPAETTQNEDLISEQQAYPKGKKLRTHGEVLAYVEQAAKEIIIEELARKGIGNLQNINHALSYFKALQKEELITSYNEHMQKVRQKAIEDMRLYFYLREDQIKNMVFSLLAPYLEEIRKSIR